MSHKVIEAGSLKVGRYLVIDDEPCKVVSIEKSKTGKHGHAKARIVAVGVFDGSKRSVVYPSDFKVDSPVIDKRVAQVNYITDATPPVLGLMDMESYETFDIKISEELKDQVVEGVQVLYWIIMNDKVVKQVK